MKSMYEILYRLRDLSREIRLPPATNYVNQQENARKLDDLIKELEKHEANRSS